MALEPEQVLLLQNLVAIPTALVYMVVAYVVGQRNVSKEAVTANRAFQTWWGGMAVLTMFMPTIYLLDRLAVVPFHVFLFLFHMVVVVLILAVACLVYFLMYVYVGRPWVLWPVAAYHLVILAWINFLVTVSRPIAHGVDCAGGLCYENELAMVPGAQWLIAALLIPILGAASAYVALLFRVDGRPEKFRIGLVAGALLLWFGSSLVAGGLDLAARYPTWPILSTVIGLASALLVFAAYRPPRWVQARLQRAGA